MDEKNKVSKSSVIIYCIGAVIWNFNWLLDLIYGYTDSSSFMLHLIIATVWDVLAVVWIFRYRKSKKDRGIN